MKEIIKHLIAENIEIVASKSYLNWFVQGLHRICFLDTKELSIYLFIVDPLNGVKPTELPIQVSNSTSTIFQLEGSMIISKYDINPDGQKFYKLENNKNFVLESIGETRLQLSKVVIQTLTQLQTKLYPKDLYSFECAKDKKCAWIMLESNKIFSGSDKSVYHVRPEYKIPPLMLFREPTGARIEQLLKVYNLI